MKRSLLALLLLVVGCFGDNVVVVSAVDGSNDHRIFRIGSATKLMMEPVLWRLEDEHLIDFDLPVGRYFKDPLPPEFDLITLRMLHDNQTGLPRELLNPWCLGDVYSAFKCGCVGSNIYDGFDTRREFLQRLWQPYWRSAVRDNEPGYSNMGYALMMMAICDELATTPEALCQKYLVAQYGLRDTSFEKQPGRINRLTPAVAGHLPWWRFKGQAIPENREGTVTMFAGGMLSSASDMLKVCYVIMPHLKRSKGILAEYPLDDGSVIYYRTGMIYGGHAFVGFDPKEHRAAVILKNTTCWDVDDGIELLEQLRSKEKWQN